MSFDMFEGLERLSARDLRWYDMLSPEEKKAASPFVMTRWMVGTSDQAQLLRINTFVNPYVFSLGPEKALLFKLLAAAATGHTRRYTWMKPLGSKGATKLKLEAIKQFYEMSTREASLSAANVSAEDVIEMAESLGWDKDDLARLKKEVADGPGSTEKVGSSKAKPKR